MWPADWPPFHEVLIVTLIGLALYGLAAWRIGGGGR